MRYLVKKGPDGDNGKEAVEINQHLGQIDALVGQLALHSVGPIDDE